jgi:hypothetical protein
MRMSGAVYLAFRQALARLGERGLRIHRIAWHEIVLHVVGSHESAAAIVNAARLFGHSGGDLCETYPQPVAAAAACPSSRR